MARVAASLWSVPRDEQRSRLAAAVAAGLEWVHWDATDGDFAVAGGFSATSAELLLGDLEVCSEAHLMLRHPIPQIPEWARLCSLIAVPVEIEDWPAAVRRIESAGATPALAVSPGTDLAEVPHAGLPVLVMSVHPGAAGAPFRPGTIDRVRSLVARGCHPTIGVDGGVGSDQLPGLGQAGATWIVSGTSLFSAPDTCAWLTAARSTLPQESAAQS